MTAVQEIAMFISPKIWTSIFFCVCHEKHLSDGVNLWSYHASEIHDSWKEITSRTNEIWSVCYKRN